LLFFFVFLPLLLFWLCLLRCLLPFGRSCLLLSDYRCSSLEELTPFFLSRLTTEGLRTIISAVPLSLRALPCPGCFPSLGFPSSWLPLLCACFCVFS
jgi:hypothetical protein